MLINLWYVAEWSENLKKLPVRVKLLGQHFVLFRDENDKAHCLSDTCLHRGGSLGQGTCVNGNVACPYHGWQYNGEGKCVFIPSEGNGYQINERAFVDSYPVSERYGMIWVFMGDIKSSERLPIPPFPEFSDDKWRQVKSDWIWKADSARVVENGIDVAHTSFVHPMFGYSETAHKNKIISIEKHNGWATSTNEMYPPQLKGGIRKIIRKDKAKTRVHTAFYMAGQTVRIHIEANPKWHIVMFDANTPVDEKTTKTFAIQVRNFFTHRIFDSGSLKRLKKVLQEDTDIVEQSQPFFLSHTLDKELSVKSDRFMGVYRKMRRQLIEDKGWEIDSDVVLADKGKQLYSIPSPARAKAIKRGITPVLPAIPLTKNKTIKEQSTNEKVDLNQISFSK